MCAAAAPVPSASSSRRGCLFLVLGATGGTGRHFVAQALKDGHRVRAFVRSAAKLRSQTQSIQSIQGTGASQDLEVVEGSIADANVDTDALVTGGVDCVISMLGDKEVQRYEKINAAFVRRLVPSMRRHGVKRFLYQAGGLSRPYQGSLSPLLWVLRYTLARGFAGQHEDNEAVMEYLATEANDIEWIVHRAGIGSDGPSKGALKRSNTDFSVATHVDCADYNLRTIGDSAAVRTCDFSCYGA